MPLATWPAGVTLVFKESDYRERPDRNVDQFQVDHGTPLESRGQSVPGTTISGTIPCNDADEYADLEEFYRDDLSDGVLHFTRTHPRTAAADCEFKFESFELTRVFGDLHEVAVTLRYFPGV